MKFLKKTLKNILKKLQKKKLNRNKMFKKI